MRRREGWTFRVAGEPDSVLSFEATDVALRRVELRRDGIDRALVALSTALGIETLPAEEAAAAARGPPSGPRGAAGRVRRLGRGAAGGARPRRGRRRDRPRLRRHLAAGDARSPTPPRSSASGRCSPGSRPTTRRSSSTRARSPSRRPGRRLAAALVAGADRLRRPDAGRLVRLPARRPPRPPAPAGPVRDARRRRAAAARALRRPRRRRPRPPPTRWSSTTPPPTGRGCSAAMVGAVGADAARLRLRPARRRRRRRRGSTPTFGRALLSTNPAPPADPTTRKEPSHDRAHRGHRAAARARPQRRASCSPSRPRSRRGRSSGREYVHHDPDAADLRAAAARRAPRRLAALLVARPRHRLPRPRPLGRRGRRRRRQRARGAAGARPPGRRADRPHRQGRLVVHLRRQRHPPRAARGRRARR